MTTTDRAPFESRSTAHDTTWMSAAHLAGIITAFAVTWLATRVFAKDDVATIGWALSTAVLATVIAGIGSPHAAIGRMSGANPVTQAERLVAILVAVGITSLAASLVWLFVAGPALAKASGEAGYTDALGAVAIWIPAGVGMQMLEATSRARGDFRQAATRGDWVRRSTLIVMFLLVATGVSNLAVGDALRAAAFAELTAVAIFLVLIVRQLPAVPRPSVRRVASQARECAVFLPTSVSAVVVPQAGIWLLSLVASADDVADLAVAVRVSFLVAIPFFIGGRVFGPRIAGVHDLADLEPQIRRFALIATAVAVVASALFVVAGEPIIGVVFGDDYRPAAAPLAILAVGQIIVAATGLCGQCLNYRHHQRFVAVVSIVGSIAFVPLALLGGSVWASAGVAAAAGVVVSAQNIAMMLAAQHRLGVRTTPAWSQARASGDSTADGLE